MILFRISIFEVLLLVAALPNRHVLGGAGRAVGVGVGRGGAPPARGGGGRPVRRQDLRAGDDRTGQDLPQGRRGDVHQVRVEQRSTTPRFVFSKRRSGNCGHHPLAIITFICSQTFPK